jgi:hypothetical protein
MDPECAVTRAKNHMEPSEAEPRGAGRIKKAVPLQYKLGAKVNEKEMRPLFVQVWELHLHSG